MTNKQWAEKLKRIALLYLELDYSEIEPLELTDTTDRESCLRNIALIDKAVGICREDLREFLNSYGGPNSAEVCRLIDDIHLSYGNIMFESDPLQVLLELKQRGICIAKSYLQIVWAINKEEEIKKKHDTINRKL